MYANTNLNGYQVKANNCSNLTLQNLTLQNLQVTNIFLQVSCVYLTSQLILSNSTFQNIFIQKQSNALAPLNFILFQVQKSFRSLTSNKQPLQLQSNTFYNISMFNTEGFTTSIFDNSLFRVSASQSALIINNNTFNTISVNPRGSIFMIAIPSINITNSNFTELIVSEPNGLLNLVFQTLFINQSMFTNNQNQNINGVGLMSFTNPRLNSNYLNVTINSSTFLNNSAPYGTILYTETTRMQMNFTNNMVLSNTISSEGGLFDFYNISNSSIVIKNTSFDVGLSSELGKSSNYSTNVVDIQKSPGAISIEFVNCSLSANTSSQGYFFTILDNQNMTLNISQFSYSPSNSSPNSSSSMQTISTFYGLLQTNGIQAFFYSMNISGISIVDTPLFSINLDSSDENNASFIFTNCTFSNLTTSQGIILIDSYGNYADTALDSFSIFMKHCTFSNLTFEVIADSAFFSSASSASSTGIGIITSLSRFVGRTSSQTNQTSAIILLECSFIGIASNSGGVLFSGLEPLYDSVLYLKNNTFQSITVGTMIGIEDTGNSDGGRGGIIKFVADSTSSTSSLSLTLQSNPDTTYSTTSYTILIVNDGYSSISAAAGSLFYWESQTKPVNILLANSTFDNFTIAGNGLIVYSSYTPDTDMTINQQSSISVLNVTNCSFTGLSANGSGVFYVEGAVNLFNLTVNMSHYENISVGGNGSVINILYKLSQSTIESTSRLLNNNSQQIGTIMISNSAFVNITAQNGGLLFEDSPSNFLSITLQNSQLSSLVVSGRGGIFYVNSPALSIVNNTFTNCYSETAGIIIYSTSSIDIDSTTLFSLNDISNNSNNNSNNISLIAFASTSLLIEVINTTTGMPIQLKNYQNLSNTPVLSDLIYNSLQSLTLKFTLVYQSGQRTIIVIDDSVDASVSVVYGSENEISNQYSTVQCSNSRCILIPSDITLRGTANTLIPVEVTYTSQMYTQSQNLYLELRECLPGEVNNTFTQQCLYCDYGTYSLTPKIQLVTSVL